MFTFVPIFQFFSALHRLLKGAMVANLHVPMAVAVSDRRQNVAAIQLSTPDSHFHSFQTLKVEIFFPPVKRRQRREKQKISRLQRPVFSSSVNAWICHLLGWKFEEGDSLAGEGKANLSTRGLVNRIFFLDQTPACQTF